MDARRETCGASPGQVELVERNDDRPEGAIAEDALHPWDLRAAENRVSDGHEVEREVERDRKSVV